MGSRVCILVLNWNNKEDTAQCIASLQQLTYPDPEIVLIDNGSSDDSVSYLKERFPHVTLIETGENLGYAGGNNVGIDFALDRGFDFILLLNNDTVVDPALIEGFLPLFEEEDVGIAGGKIYLMDEGDHFDHFGGNWNPRRIDFDYVAHRAQEDGKSYETPLSMDYACGAALMVRRSVFEKVGLFEERFFLFWEETDFCFRARRAGFQVKCAPKAKVWHKVSASFTGGKPHATYFFWRNRLLFIERNFHGLERAFYRLRLVAINGAALILLRSFRGLQRGLQKLMGKSTQRNTERLKRYLAAWLGMKDYFRGNFGPGSSHRFL